jgi:hypothetical protein
MSVEINNANTAKQGRFERRDIGAKGILYFLLGLAVVTLLIVLLLMGMFDFLDKREKAQQPPVNPLATNVPEDSRKLSVDYGDYLKQNFPAPQLEIDERNQLDHMRLEEEGTLNSYGWVDEKAGTVHIPIERAMDLVAERGLPTRDQSSTTQVSATQSREKKGNK